MGTERMFVKLLTLDALVLKRWSLNLMTNHQTHHWDWDLVSHTSTWVTSPHYLFQFHHHLQTIGRCHNCDGLPPMKGKYTANTLPASQTIMKMRDGKRLLL